jgi:hypothetical protein
MESLADESAPLCVDCKHYRRGHWLLGYHIHRCYCLSCVVTGEPTNDSCFRMRLDGGHCGGEGKLFERKEMVDG